MPVSITKNRKDEQTLLRMLHAAFPEKEAVKIDKFGYYGQPDRQTDCWYPFFYSMIVDTYEDAKRKNIEIKVPRKRLLGLLEKDKEERLKKKELR
jgi:hypothetical protein